MDKAETTPTDTRIRLAYVRARRLFPLDNYWDVFFWRGSRRPTGHWTDPYESIRVQAGSRQQAFDAARQSLDQQGRRGSRKRQSIQTRPPQQRPPTMLVAEIPRHQGEEKGGG